jgi:transcriptional regulator
MRHTPSFDLTDPAAIARLVHEHPWATLVSATDDGLVASHYPVLAEAGADGELTLFTHVGRPDERLHELGRHELLVIVQGPHGYISPGWYDEHPAVPTWNFVVAHLHGTPEILDAAENLRVLEQLVEHFEERMPDPQTMRGTLENSAYADRISAGTVGIRMRVDRFVAKNKMSQNRTEASLHGIVAGLEGDGPYASAELAGLVRQANPAVFGPRDDSSSVADGGAER